MSLAYFKNSFGKAAFFSFALIAFALAGCGDNAPVAPVKTAQPRQLAAPFTVKTLRGGVFTFASKRGAPVVVNFWASWCTPCAIEAPLLEKIYKEYKGRGVEFIAIAVEDAKKDAQKFVSKYGLTFPIGLDENGDITSAYRANIIPQIFFIDADGYISYAHKGIIDEETFVKELSKLMPAGSGVKAGD